MQPVRELTSVRVVATQMQKRGPAIIAAACILLAHLISLRHETTVAHVRDSVGVMEHAHALGEFHASSSEAHLHGSESHGHVDSGPCALLAGLEQSTIITRAPALVVATASHQEFVTSPALAIELGTSILAFAPKTSPPSA